MKTSITFTADDFGLHPAINKGIISLYKEGVVDRASLLVGSKYFVKSVRQLKKNAGLVTGIHLNLTDGAPVLKTEIVPSLINKNGKFTGGRHYVVAAKLLLGIFNKNEVRKEWAAQIKKAQEAGIKVRFINSHGHLHLLPVLHDIVLALAKKYKIKNVRVALNGKGIKGFALRVFSRILIKKMKTTGLDIEYPAQVLGINHQGHLSRKNVVEELKKLKIAQYQEFIVHPASGKNPYHSAWGYETKKELSALLSLS